MSEPQGPTGEQQVALIETIHAELTADATVSKDPESFGRVLRRLDDTLRPYADKVDQKAVREWIAETKRDERFKSCFVEPPPPAPKSSLEAMLEARANQPKGFGLAPLADHQQQPQRVVTPTRGEPTHPPTPTTADHLAAFMQRDRGFGLKPIG